MIFVTVGAQMPFDRLICTVDAWAMETGRSDVFIQTGNSEYTPKHVAFSRFLSPEQFRQRVTEAKVIVAHAGMGSVLTALQFGKPMIVMPRRGALRETRNDHQVASAKRLAEQGRVSVAFDETELRAKLDTLDVLVPSERLSPFASPQLISALRSFVAASGPERAAALSPAVVGLRQADDDRFEQLAGTVPGQFAGALQRR
jgi:UDP-N-acetylglucosamine transferase subunit ALG13